MRHKRLKLSAVLLLGLGLTGLQAQESRKEWLLEKFITKDSSRFWGTDNHPIELWSNKVIDQKLDYLHKNPVEEGLVFHAEHYVYSSAIDYAGEKGLLDVNII